MTTRRRRNHRPTPAEIEAFVPTLVGLTPAEAEARAAKMHCSVEIMTVPGWYTSDLRGNRIRVFVAEDRIVRAMLT